MAIVAVDGVIDAPVEKVFSSWADEYADIYKFNPNIRTSHLLNESPAETGVGALRQCDLNDGKNWVREKIVQLDENQKIIVNVIETSLPMERLILSVSFKEITPKQTHVTLQSNFTPDMGALSGLLAPFIGMKIKGMLQALLDGNAAYLENGLLANPVK